MSATLPTLSALAGILGEMEQRDDEADVPPEQWVRWDIIERAAELAPVRTPADAALALSMAAWNVGKLGANVHTDAERDARLEEVERMLSQIAKWLARDFGACTLRSIWTPAVSPHGEASA